MENKMKDIDTLTVELAKNADLSKALPPKLKYKFMKWLRSLSPDHADKQTDRRRMVETAKSELSDRIQEHMARKKLAKNEIMASTFDDGAIKFDFGNEVPERIKKAAFSWAKKRGLKAVEASLMKSVDTVDTVMFISSQTNPLRSCAKRVKWSVE